MTNVYKLIALDVDGTIVKEDRVPITPRVCRAIEEASARCHVVFCTGRSSEDLVEVLDQVDIKPSFHVCGGGSEIVGPDGRIIEAFLLTSNELQIIASRVAQLKREISYLIGTSWRCSYAEHERSLVGTVSVSAFSAEDGYEIVRTLSDLQLLFSINVASDSRDPKRAVVHIGNQMSNKGHGLCRVMSQLGIAKEEAIMVGDMLNDFPAFQVVGLKVAMGNAAHYLKESADVVVPDIEDDGAAVAIERFILKVPP